MSRQLLGHHLIWKSGTDEKQEAGSILGLIPTQKKAPEPIPPSEISDQNPYAVPKTRTIWEGPPGGMYLPHLHPANRPSLWRSIGVFVANFGRGNGLRRFLPIFNSL